MVRPAHEVNGRTVREVQIGERPSAARGADHADRPHGVPPHRTDDVRYNRPSHNHVRPPPYAHDRHVPVHDPYRHWYTRWYVHPWYRYQYSTVAVVSFGFAVHPWVDWWVPPTRAGFYWVPGAYVYGVWWPGYWAPVGTAPFGYTYVDGWWEDDAYVDGYWRSEGREGWVWVDGYYLDDGGYVRGHWAPETDAPDGYTWEAGFWDGESWIDGFWRPEFRDGYLWVSAYYDADGIFHGGYWSPLEDRSGYLWIPGWFDGNGWIEGYWVDEREVTDDALDWPPPEGVRDGWDEEAYDDGTYDEVNPPGRGAAPESRLIEKPLAIPVVVPEPE